MQLLHSNTDTQRVATTEKESLQRDHRVDMSAERSGVEASAHSETPARTLRLLLLGVFFQSREGSLGKFRRAATSRLTEELPLLPGLSRTEPSKAEPSRAEPSWTEGKWTKLSWAELSWETGCIPDWGWGTSVNKQLVKDRQTDIYIDSYCI